MTRFFLALYDFFAPRRRLLAGLTAAAVLLFALLATRVRFDENITDIFPKTADGQNMSMVFNNLKSKDRIIVLFSARDADVTEDDLIGACDAFAERLGEPSVREGIPLRHLRDRRGGNFPHHRLLYDYLPVFLDEADYARIDSLLENGGIGPVMERNYQRLLSPAGIGLGGFIARDPLSDRREGAG